MTSTLMADPVSHTRHLAGPWDSCANARADVAASGQSLAALQPLGPPQAQLGDLSGVRSACRELTSHHETCQGATDPTGRLSVALPNLHLGVKKALTVTWEVSDQIPQRLATRRRIWSPRGRRREAGGHSPQGTERTWWESSCMQQSVLLMCRQGQGGFLAVSCSRSCQRVPGAVKAEPGPRGGDARPSRRAVSALTTKTLHPLLSSAISEAKRKRGTDFEMGKDRPRLNEDTGVFRCWRHVNVICRLRP